MVVSICDGLLYTRSMPVKIKPTNAETIPLSRLEALFKKVQRDENGCWLWTGRLSEAGYARFSVKNREVFGHRVTFALVNGEPTEILDHLCRTRACMNPSHLREATVTENNHNSDSTLAVRNAKKSHCPKGHAYSGKNLYINPNNGDRICRTCHRDWARNNKKPAI